LEIHRLRCGNPVAGPIFANALGKPLALSTLGAGQPRSDLCLCVAGRGHKNPRQVPGFPHSLERHRTRCSTRSCNSVRGGALSEHELEKLSPPQQTWLSGTRSVLWRSREQNHPNGDSTSSGLIRLEVSLTFCGQNSVALRSRSLSGRRVFLHSANRKAHAVYKLGFEIRIRRQGDMLDRC
jgi:hypothetical protein